MKITIVRHGQPEFTASQRISSSEFGTWIEAYDRASLCPKSLPSLELQQLADESAVLICSDMRRSIESAMLLYRENIVLKDEQFREAGLPYGRIVIVKMRPSQWVVLFRVVWFLGYSNNAERLADAKSRSVCAAARLQELADEYGNVLYVGHGIFNRMVSNALTRNGWYGSKPESTHWGFNTLER